MKVDLKQPRYVLPLIVLPFLFIFFYIYKSSWAAPLQAATDSKGLQDQVGEVSEEVKNRTLADKLAAYKDQFRRGDGYTAIGQLQEEKPEEHRFDDLYNEQEKRKLDSIARGLTLSGGNAEIFQKSSTDNAAMQDALSSLNRQQQGDKEEDSPDPMDLFRRQMAFADSLAKASDPELRAMREQNELAERRKLEAESRPVLTVSKAESSTAVFNTVRPQEMETFIQAIVDQNIQGYVDSRLRIRLLDDLLVGRYLVRKGTYLYATISGFSGQRVLFSIRSIMSSGKLLPVNLEIYDNDGLAGLYVPASAFREFTKDLGGNVSQGLTLQQQADNNSQIVMSTIQKMFQSTTTAVTKHIRRNKANLKFGTIVNLIDTRTLRKQQETY
ncbi:conjugative transposon protein TraM [Sphingobacterium suaedae]|uniref:Conjugative transposon protein TraM n=1 Tax=Sphingobacterium suaedae TaxID=1686402 RepID=A0ABW5KLN6_9SPHI